MDIFVSLVILFVAVVLHEYAHGWTAYRLGDPTAKLAGRLTFNPIKHVDPLGTLILPGILLTLRFLGMNTFIFGWAKPVPVNFLQLRNPRRDMILVALAGPSVNIISAFMFSLLIPLDLPLWAVEVLAIGIFINLLLAVFNMIPIPPLDGSRVLMGILPPGLGVPYAKLEPYGMLIVIALLYFGVFERIVMPAVLFLGDLMGVKL